MIQTISSTQAKLNVQHDYITLRVKFANGDKVNLTKSHRGETASGTVELRPALAAFGEFLERGKGRSYGEAMKHAALLAEKSTTVADFLAALRA